MISLLNLKYLGNEQFAVAFSDGSEGLFNLHAYLANRQGSLLLPLREEAYVARAFVESGAMAWPNGLELAPQRVLEMTQLVKRAA
ncbi:MAG: DUF2442 domain-containing protein [Azonexus sp.]|nr:DUF2442 domain-containing protein [Azonexus sp.]